MDIFRSLSPSSVRKIILEEHGQLRDKLSQVESVMEGKDSNILINAVRELLYFFIKHIANEEQILRPVLKDIDAWGEERVNRMNKEHAQQRQSVNQIEKALNKGNLKEVITLVKKFTSELHVDMTQEEKECLSPDLLKDDPITSSNYSG